VKNEGDIPKIFQSVLRLCNPETPTGQIIYPE